MKTCAGCGKDFKHEPVESHFGCHPSGKPAYMIWLHFCSEDCVNI